jgi:thiosulfate dehydrogenase [quinone] large subunit
MAKVQRSIRKNITLTARARTALTPFASVGVAALILRVFLGGTMLYAGLDKLILDPRFLQSDGVGSIGETLRYFVTSGGPLAPLVEAVAISQPVAVGAAMAIAQLVVAGSLLTGSWVRSGALLGAAISLTLALTSTWGVSPYYLGNDLPYLVGFLVLAALGDGGMVRVGAPARRGYDPTRRAAIVSSAGIVALLAALVLLDRARFASLLAGGSASSGTPTPSATPATSPTPDANATASPSDADRDDDDDDDDGDDDGAKTPKPSESATGGGGSGSGGTASGSVISGAQSLASGQALNFSAGGTAAVLLKDGGTYRAFERACTHQGTNVDWEAGNDSFYCNNHGARFSATGEAIVGPARTPLRPIEVSVAADGSVTYRR